MTIYALADTNVSAELQTLYSSEWNAVQLYTGNTGAHLVVPASELKELADETAYRNLFIHSNRDTIEMWCKSW